MGSQFQEQDEAERDAKQRLTTEWVMFGVFVLIVVGVHYLFGLVTGRSSSTKDLWWLALGVPLVWLENKFEELRSRTKQMNAKLSHIEERLGLIEERLK